MTDIPDDVLDEVERILGELSVAWQCATVVQTTTIGELVVLAEHHNRSVPYRASGRVLTRLRAAREVK